MTRLTPATAPWTPTADGVRLSVRAQPGAQRTAIDGLVVDAQGRPHLKIRIHAPPVEGAANDALTAFLAKALGVRQRDIRLLSGETSRTKLLEITGPDTAIIAALERLTTL